MIDLKYGAGIGSRTPNLQIRSLALYPVELCLHKRTANKRISAGDSKQIISPKKNPAQRLYQSPGTIPISGISD